MKKFIQKNEGTFLFLSFMFLQMALLGLANHAGEGLLSSEKREHIYYVLQVLVIIGFWGFAATESFVKSGTVRKIINYTALSALAAGTLIMSLNDKATVFYITVSFAVMPFLGGLGGAVYYRMSRLCVTGRKIAGSMGIGCAAAVALQYVLQLRWGETPLLPFFMIAALGMIIYLLRSETEESESEDVIKTTPQVLLFACLTAAVFILFTGFYNGHIHHLQIKSAYTDYNVYSWPRLILIPCYLLFALIGDRRQGRLVPVVSLSISLAALLNSVLAGSSGAYSLNMCLFYCAIAAAVSYYNLSFWRLAGGTGHPAFWASMGRVTDSLMVLLCAGCQISKAGAPLVLALNIASLALLILLMALSGAFNLSETADEDKALQKRSPESTLMVLKDRFSLTPRETDVLRELVLTEDKQAAISMRLSITVTSLQRYVTSIYKKTGTGTRSGLAVLYHKTMNGQ